jgi:hypothetical protein
VLAQACSTVDAGLLPLMHINSIKRLVLIRGGLVPQADSRGRSYFERFAFDQTPLNTTHWAGHTKTLVPAGSLLALNAREKDPFLKWWNEYLEYGPPTSSATRIKPFYVRRSASSLRR